MTILQPPYKDILENYDEYGEETFLSYFIDAVEDWWCTLPEEVCPKNWDEEAKTWLDKQPYWY